MSYEFEQVEAERVELQQQRDFGEKINATFEFLKLNFSTFYRGILFIICPIAVVAGIASSFIAFQPADLVKAIMNSDIQEISKLQGDMYGIEYFASLILGLIGFILLPAYVYSYMRKYLENDDDFSVASLFSATLSEFLRTLGASIVLILIVFISYFIGVFATVLMGQIAGFFAFFGGLGTICLVFYLTTVFFLVYPIMLVEKQNFGTALSKSFYLVKGKWWSTFGLLVVMIIIYILLSIITSIPLMVVTGLLASNSLSDSSVMTTALNIIANIISQIGGYMILPLIIIAVCFQYFNLSEMKQSTGLLSRIEGFGSGKQEDEEETY